jgi:Na+/H+-dicarboxylate symporter
VTDQLAPGLALAGIAAAAAISGVGWLALAAILAAVPFLVAGVGLAVGRHRGRHGGSARTAR